jgi:hypothetical protein
MPASIDLDEIQARNAPQFVTSVEELVAVTAPVLRISAREKSDRDVLHELYVEGGLYAGSSTLIDAGNKARRAMLLRTRRFALTGGRLLGITLAPDDMLVDRRTEQGGCITGTHYRVGEGAGILVLTNEIFFSLNAPPSSDEPRAYASVLSTQHTSPTPLAIGLTSQRLAALSAAEPTAAYLLKARPLAQVVKQGSPLYNL